MDKAKTKNILEDSKKIDVMSLIEHRRSSPQKEITWWEKKRKKKEKEMGIWTLKGRITCEFTELLVHFENQYEKSNYEFVNF